MEHSSISGGGEAAPRQDVLEGLAEFAASREDLERRTLDDTEQLAFIGVVAREAIQRLGITHDERAVTRALVTHWWCEGDDSLGARYRQLCCCGADLRRDLYAQFQNFHEHRDRAQLIARAMRFADFEIFFKESLPHIRTALVRAGMLDGATAVTAETRGRANGATKTA